MPVQRDNITLSNIDLLSAVLYVAEQVASGEDCPPTSEAGTPFPPRMNRWAKKGVLAKLQKQQEVKINLEAVSIDSTSIKVHPDGTGA